MVAPLLELRNLRETPEAIPQLARWFHQTWGYLRPGRTAADIEKRLQNNLRRQGVPFTVVCYHDGVLVGAASATNSDMETHPSLGPWLATVFVHPDYRCRGIGEAVVREVLAQLKIQGITKAYLFTSTREAWYQKMGWRLIERYRYHREMVAVMSYIL